MEPPVSEPRPSGVKPAATAAAEPPLLPPGTVLGVARVPRRPEGRVLRRAAHGELVHVRLAECDGPGVAERLHDGGVVGRAPAVQDPGAARGDGSPACTDCPSAPPAPPPAGPDRARRPRPRRRRRRRPAPRRRGRLRKAWSSPSPDATAARASSTTSRAERCPERTSAARVQRGAHGASPPIRGTRKRWSSTAGAAASTSSRSRLGRGSSARKTLLQGDRVRRRLQVRQVERRHVGGVIEHGPQLLGEELDLLVAQIQPGQVCDVDDVLPAQSRRVAGVVGHGRGGSTPVTNSTVRASISSLSQSSVATW